MSIKQALETFMQTAQKRVVNALPRATGKTAESIKYSAGEWSAELYQEGGWFQALVEGRGKSKGGEDEGFKEALLAWMKTSGGEHGGFEATAEGAYGLAMFIHEQGTRLNQGKGVSSLQGINFDEELKVLTNTIALRIQADVVTNLNKRLK